MKFSKRVREAIRRASPEKQYFVLPPPENHICLGELSAIERKIYNAWQEQRLITALVSDTEAEESLKLASEKEWQIQISLHLLLLRKIQSRLRIRTKKLIIRNYQIYRKTKLK